MESLASAWDAIAARVRRAGAVAVGLDFDGTLTPLRERPEVVELDPSTRDVLRRLAAVPGVTVAVVSGRALADLAARLAVPGAILVGNHGFERRLPGGPARLVLGGADLEAVRAAARALAAAAAGVPGVWVKDKGPTLALHYRQVAPELREGLCAAVRVAAARLPPTVRVDEGHRVFDIRPATPAVTKGTAFREVLAEAGVPAGAMVWYVGDDVTDEDAFAALPADAVTVRVGDPGGLSAARYGVADPAEVVRRLDALREAAARRPAAGR